MPFPVILVNVSRKTNQIQFPIGLSVIANALQKNGIRPEIIDLIPIQIDLRESYFRERIPDGPAIFGFGIMLGGKHWAEVEKYAAMIKEQNPEHQIVYGGSFPSSLPELMLERSHCDYIVHGEGERTFPKLISQIRLGRKAPESIPGVFFKLEGSFKGSRNRRIAVLDELSNPDLDPFDMEFYTNYLSETGQSWEIMASRGCNGNCSFCYKFMGKGLSLRNLEHVFAEIEYVIHRFDMRKFYFVDENFLQVKKYFLDFIEEKRRRKLDFVFVGQSRVDSIDIDICEIGSENGLICISTGIESASQRTLDLINKRISVEDAKNKIDLMRKFGITPSVNFIIGFPWETEQDYFDLHDFIIANHLEKHTKLSYLTPLPATKLFEGVLEKGLIEDVFEYATSLDNLYWERYVNLTSLPDEIIDYHYARISNLGKRDPFRLQSEKYIKQIREIH